MVLLETSATAVREYGSVPFHFANDALWPDVCCLSCRVWRRRRSEGAAERFNKWAATQSLSATQEGASEGFCLWLWSNAHEELEPISKSSEEDNEAGELDEAEEVLGVILPADGMRRCHWIQAKKRSTSQRRM